MATDPARPLEFDGPANWHCLGIRYVTLTHEGIKEQGIPHYSTCATSNEAFAKYWVQLEGYSAGAEQLAWRLRPVAEEQDGGFIVRSRLARWPEERE